MQIEIVLVLATTCCAPVLSAQQVLELYPGATHFTSRGNLSVNAGETLQGIHSSHFRGIGDNCAACVIPNLRGLIQDQNAATQETFHWIVRKGDDTNGPGVGTANELARIGPLQPPKSTSTGAMAWQLTTALTRAVQLPDCESHFSFGLALSAAPRWTTDGLSTHGSRGNSPEYQRSHVRAEDHAWQILGGASQATHPSVKRTWRYSLLLANGVLQFGNGLNFYGMGGMFPEAGHPVTARARYGSRMAGGRSFLFLATKRGAGVMLFPSTSRLFIGGTIFFVSGVSIAADGESVHLINAALPAACIGSPRHHAQAVAMKGSVYVVTNVHSINP